MISSAIDCVFVIDTRGTILMANGAASNLFGYSREEMLGHKVNMLMPEPHATRHDQYLGNYLRTGEARIIGKGREEHGRRKDGSLFPMRLAVTRIELEGEIFFAGIIHDLTDLRAAEAEIERMNRELERKVVQRTLELEEKNAQLLETNNALSREIRERQQIEAQLRHNERELQAALDKEKELNELKSRFVSMASHEFRTPLSTILSSAGLITRYPEEAQQAQRLRHIERIKSSVSMLTGILDDFLSLAKLEEGRITVNPEDFELIELATEVVEALRPNLKEGQAFRVEEAGEEIPLFQDRHLLKNLMYNLLSNAIKYSPEHSPILLRILSIDGRVRIEVQDKGIGIPRQDQHRLFTRFFRANNATNIQGTGLGLNIVRHYAQIMGGDIGFVSDVGKGSTFFVHLPFRIPATP
jgi:two-component system sensor kinase FixL